MNYEWELYRNGLMRTIKLKNHPYDVIEFTMMQNLVDEQGRVIVNNCYTNFFSKKEFVDFFAPIVKTISDEINVGVSNGDENNIQG